MPRRMEETYSPVSYSSDNTEGDVGEFDAEISRFPYTSEDYRRIFTEFYQYLVDLYISPDALQLPPSEGWPDFPSDIWGNLRTEKTLEVLRHMPILSGNPTCAWKSTFYNYRNLYKNRLRLGREGFDGPFDSQIVDYSFHTDIFRSPAHVITICRARGSHGLRISLDIKFGCMIQEV